MRRGVLIGLSMLLVGGVALAAAPWAGPGGGDNRSGVADAQLTAPLFLDWRYVTEDATWTAASPAATDSIVVFAVNKKLYGIDPNTGNKKWEFQTTGVINSSPTIDQELVFVGDQVGMLYAVNVDTGRQFFNYRDYGEGEQPVPIQSGFAVVDNIVYFGDDKGIVHRVRARADYPTEPGKSIGKRNLGESIIAAPTHSRGTLYVCTLTGVVALQNLAGDMEQRWSVTLARGGSYVLGSPTVSADGERVLVPVGTSLVALNANTGAVVWNAAALGSVVGGPAVKDDRVIFADTSGVVSCVSLANGDEIWHEPLTEGVRTGPEFDFDRQTIQTSPIVAGDLVLARSRKGTVVAMSLTDGKVLWRYKTEDLKDPSATQGTTGGMGGSGGMMGPGAMGPGAMGSGGGMAPGGMGPGAMGAAGGDSAKNGGKGVTGYSVAEDLSSGLAAIGDRLFILGGTGTLYALSTQGICSSRPYVRTGQVFIPDNTGTVLQTGTAVPVYDERGEPDRDTSRLPSLFPAGKLPPDGPIVFQVKIGDLGAGLDPASINVTLDGPMQLVDPLYFESAESIQVYLPERNARRALDPGDYKLRFEAANYAGRKSVHEIRFTIDPSLQSPAPAGQGGMMGPGGMGSGGMGPGMMGPGGMGGGRMGGPN